MLCIPECAAVSLSADSRAAIAFKGSAWLVENRAGQLRSTMTAIKELPAKQHSARRARWLLLSGAFAGIALAATGVLRGPASMPQLPQDAPELHAPAALPVGAVARVNGRLITDEDFRQVLALEVAVGADADANAKERVLDRMIDEELRVQRAVELKLHLSDPRVRMDLASAVAEAATAGAERDLLSEPALRAYFERRREYFAQRGPLRIRQIWVGILAGNIGEAFNRARAATKLLGQKEPFETVRDLTGNAEPRPIPNRLLCPAELAQHLGRTALNAALAMKPGDIGDPIRAAEGFHVLQVLERQPQASPNFESSRLDVEAEFWSEHAREALEANAAGLRENARIERAKAL